MDLDFCEGCGARSRYAYCDPCRSIRAAVEQQDWPLAYGARTGPAEPAKEEKKCP